MAAGALLATIATLLSWLRVRENASAGQILFDTRYSAIYTVNLVAVSFSNVVFFKNQFFSKQAIF